MNYAQPSDADRVRMLIEKLGLSQRAAAEELDISDRTMRSYCAGRDPVPRMVLLALERLVDLGRRVEEAGRRETGK